MTTLSFDPYQTLGVAVVFLLIGKYIRSKTIFFQKYAIPAPVIGGLIFSAIALILRQTEILGFEYDETFRNLFMTLFFCSVGFNASFRIIKNGGKKVVVFLLIATLLAILQNVLALSLAPLVGMSQPLALMTGSTPMSGGHGTSAAIAPILEKKGIVGAETIAFTAATFGLLAGSLMGGPIANRLIIKNNLMMKRKENEDNKIIEDLSEEIDTMSKEKYFNAFFILVISTGLGVFITKFINSISPEFQIAIYIGPMILGMIFRNSLENTKWKIPMNEMRVIGDFSLQLFLAIALMTLKLWQLTDVAFQLLILLFAQAIFIYLFATFITFRFMGKDYDAAVITAGHVGFGMGATPNGIANMQSVCEKYEYSGIAFMVISIIGGFFLDFTNVFQITFFINKVM